MIFLEMKKLTLVVFLLLQFSPAKSQFDDNSFIISLHGSQVISDRLSQKYAYGVDIQYFISENVSLNYHFNGGKGYLHMPLALPLAVLLFTHDFIYWEDDLFWLLLLSGLLLSC